MWWKALLLTITITTTHLCVSQETNIGTPAACTLQQTGSYKSFDSQQGINGFDGTGSHILTYKARTRILGFPRYWQPYNEDKQVLCGILDRFSWFHTTWTSEQDWNNVVTPHGYFRQMLDEAVGLGANRDEMVECAQGESKGDCLELETTPQKQFWINQFFGRGASHYDIVSTTTNGLTSLNTQNVCFYGPWVNDTAHGSRPEIHPTELVWWRDRDANGASLDRWYLIAHNDDSTRFDTTGGFVLPSPVPSDWRPWASRPHDADFIVPFTVNSSPAAFSLGAYDVNTLNPVGSTDLNAILKVNGQTMVTVEKPASPTKFKITFSSQADSCIDPGGQLHGYFDLRLQIGKPPKREEGSLMLQLAKAPVQLAPVIDRPQDREEEEPEYVPGSLLSTAINHSRVLSGEFKIPPLGRLLRGLMVPPEATHKCKQTQGNCVEVPLLGSAPGSSVMLLEEKPVGALPVIALTYNSRLMTPQVKMAATSAPNFARAMGVAQLPSGVRVVSQPRQLMQIHFEYVPVKDGRLASEEESGPTSDLNQALYSKDARTRIALFGNGPAFTIEQQSFKVFDETARANVDGGNAILHYDGGEWQIDVTFPATSEGHLMRGDFTATVLGGFGDHARVEQQFWNEALRVDKEGKTFDQMLGAIATLSGLDAETLVLALQPSANRAFPNRDVTRLQAMTFQTRVKQILETTDIITFDDLRKLRNLAIMNGR